MSEAPVKTKKRFIAGAVCPACIEPDKLMMWSEDDVSHRECVACGYSDTLNEQGLSVPKELGTRVNTSALKAPDPKVQAVQFFPNPKLKKTDREALPGLMAQGATTQAVFSSAGSLALSAVFSQLFIEHSAKALVLHSPLASAVRNLSTSAFIM